MIRATILIALRRGLSSGIALLVRLCWCRNVASVIIVVSLIASLIASLALIVVAVEPKGIRIGGDAVIASGVARDIGVIA